MGSGMLTMYQHSPISFTTSLYNAMDCLGAVVSFHYVTLNTTVFHVNILYLHDDRGLHGKTMSH